MGEGLTDVTPILLALSSKKKPLWCGAGQYMYGGVRNTQFIRTIMYSLFGLDFYVLYSTLLHLPPSDSTVYRRMLYCRTGSGLLQPETQIKRQENQRECLPSWLGDGHKRPETMYSDEKKYFALGRLATRAAKARQKSLVSTLFTSPTTTREGPFYLYSLSPHLPLNNQQGTTPLYSLSGYDFGIGRRML